MSDDVDRIAAVIQRVYGDASQTRLDRECARAVLDELRAAGWADRGWVAALVVSAGGEITVTEASLTAPAELMVVQLPASSGYRVRARSTALAAGDGEKP